ncbi:MAG: hypothetical protein P8L78_09110 [Mariniblastus sp.]|nr:hypothetical protein [Mariniblastus sp.]MDG2181837.1 hypothetical protein [Mariniblastus sp.]
MNNVDGTSAATGKSLTTSVENSSQFSPNIEAKSQGKCRDGNVL